MTVTVKPLYFDTYLAVINNSVGSKAYQNFFALVDGEKRDIIENGDMACAYFVSSVLHQFRLIAYPHTMVPGLVKDMEMSGWKKIDEPRVGAVVVWEPNQESGEREHAGFYVEPDQVISNNSSEGNPIKHHWTYGEKDGQPIRKITAIYWHPHFDHQEYWI
jgi:hypothetical protein